MYISLGLFATKSDNNRLNQKKETQSNAEGRLDRERLPFCSLAYYEVRALVSTGRFL